MTKFRVQLIFLLVFIIPGTLSALSPAAEAEAGIADQIGKSLNRLYAENPELSIGASSIAVGPFTWDSSGIGTVFSETLLRAGKSGVLKSDVFQLVIDDPVPFFGEESSVPELNEMDMVSAYRLFGSYQIEEADVIIRLKLYSSIFSRMMAESDISIPLSDIPREIELYPENREVVDRLDRELGALYGKDQLNIHITTDRGIGGVYREGEELTLSLLADKDCYIKIFHIDVAGKMTQLFPNRFESNNYLPGRQLLTFPSRRSPFRFKIVPPYGTETIKVIASTRQFYDPGDAFSDLGVATRGLVLEGVSEAETEVMADAMVHFTILREQE